MNEVSLNIQSTDTMTWTGKPDLQLLCKVNEHDYLDVFLGEAKIAFIAHFNDFEITEQHIVSLCFNDVSRMINFISSDTQELSFNDESSTFALARTPSGCLAFRLSMNGLGYAQRPPVFVFTMTSVSALSSLLRDWMRQQPVEMAAPRFGLS